MASPAQQILAENVICTENYNPVISEVNGVCFRTYHFEPSVMAETIHNIKNHASSCRKFAGFIICRERNSPHIIVRCVCETEWTIDQRLIRDYQMRQSKHCIEFEEEIEQINAEYVSYKRRKEWNKSQIEAKRKQEEKEIEEASKKFDSIFAGIEVE